MYENPLNQNQLRPQGTFEHKSAGARSANQPCYFLFLHNMKILSIETSCDETAISLLSVSKSKIEVMGDALYSQVKIHEQYGGVFPMMAKREHQNNLCPLLIKVLEESGFLKHNSKPKNQKEIQKLRKILERETDLVEHFITNIINIKKPKIDVIAVTKGPGLEPALWVGISFAKALGALWGIPVIGVNHMEGHIVSVLLNKDKNQKTNTVQFPTLSLLVSGGHTEFVLAKDWGKYKIVGKTRDDAVGEAFDKVARILGLPYPGGPQISKLADSIRDAKNKIQNENREIKLPRPMLHTKDFDFSFSGLKTAVLYMVRDIPEMTEDIKAQIAKEFEDASVDVLIHKTRKALEHYKAKTLIVGGGVSANKHLRNELAKLEKETGITIIVPDKSLATDNAQMIGVAGYMKWQKSPKADKTIKAEGHLSFS